jgi:hypothetical protein
LSGKGIQLRLEPHPDDFVEDRIATVCVFAWEERARESCAGNLEKVRQYLATYF